MKDYIAKLIWPLATLVFIILLSVFLTNNYKNALHQAKDKAAQDKLELAASVEEVLQRERTAVRRLAEVSTHHQKELDHEKNRFQTYTAGVRSGTVRVSVPVTQCASNTALPDTALARIGETRAELAPEAAASLAAIASEGNQAIIGLNSCIDQYNTGRDTFNAAKPDPKARGNDVQAQ